MTDDSENSILTTRLLIEGRVYHVKAYRQANDWKVELTPAKEEAEKSVLGNAQRLVLEHVQLHNGLLINPSGPIWELRKDR